MAEEEAKKEKGKSLTERMDPMVKMALINITIWVILADIFAISAAVMTHRFTYNVILLGFIMGVVIAIINILMTMRIITDKIAEISGKLTKVAEGDLTVGWGKESGLFKKIVEEITKTIEGIKNIVTQVASSTDHILSLAENLSSSTEQINASSEEITSTVQQIARGVEQQAERTVETSRIMENMSQSIQTVAQKSEEVLGVATAAKTATTNGLAAVNETAKKIDDIVAVTDKAKNSIIELRSYSEKIEEIVNIITEIADETNLLALNAAIEAARAGDAGRGFAVVADEVRKLAEGSAQAAKEIARLVEDIHDKTESVVQAIMIGAKETEEGKLVVKQSGDALLEIDNVVTKVVDLTHEIFNLTKAQAEDTDKVVKAVEEIAAVAEETAAGTQQASASTEQQTASMQEIAAQAQELAQTAEVLKTLVNKFRFDKVKER
jgi:methyl-accepting chemotaxis protein